MAMHDPNPVPAVFTVKLRVPPDKGMFVLLFHGAHWVGTGVHHSDVPALPPGRKCINPLDQRGAHGINQGIPRSDPFRLRRGLRHKRRAKATHGLQTAIPQPTRPLACRVFQKIEEHFLVVPAQTNERGAVGGGVQGVQNLCTLLSAIHIITNKHNR